ncbi:unnamed protein product [Echinostoma caproni]|uniref:SMP-30/Gluconolactonase/LRE-like region domain-containing protein n=1 Tax=Echinostoma caproni TaxID=27848 RepID=A0A3P8L603_9TREM|nr:unnamed protein product [Echinostoma caproni]
MLVVNPRNGKWRVFVDGLHFANGVQLHRDGQSVLVAETTRGRVVRIPLDGKTPSTVFADGLPGFPDNIRLSPRGGYWIPVNNVRNGSLFSWMMEFSPQWPIIRRIAHRITSLVPWFEFEKSKTSMLLRVDEEGRTIEVWHDPKNRVSNVAEVCEADGHLYTGSYYLPYIGKAKI